MQSYETKLEAEASRWADHREARLVKRSWLQSDVVLEHVNRRTTGNPHLDWIQWIKREYSTGANRRRALSLGCNDGVFERQLVASGFVHELDGMDISSEAIAAAQEAANRDGLAAHFKVGDVNTLDLEPESYDLVLCVMAMHHFERLEPVLDQINRALKPSGFLLLNEYIGASRFQWPARQLRLATDVLQLLPKHRRQLRDGTTRESIIAPPLADILKTDPFEAVRSAEIISHVRHRMSVVAECDYGGSILHLVLHDIIHNFDEELPEDCEVLDLLCGVEEMLLENAGLDSDFAVVVARKRLVPPEWGVAHPVPGAPGTADVSMVSEPTPFQNRLALLREQRAQRTRTEAEPAQSQETESRVSQLEHLLRERETELEISRRHLRAVERGRVLRALNFVHRARKRLGL